MQDLGAACRVGGRSLRTSCPSLALAESLSPSRLRSSTDAPARHPPPNRRHLHGTVHPTDAPSTAPPPNFPRSSRCTAEPSTHGRDPSVESSPGQEGEPQPTCPSVRDCSILPSCPPTAIDDDWSISLKFGAWRVPTPHFLTAIRRLRTNLRRLPRERSSL